MQSQNEFCQEAQSTNQIDKSNQGIQQAFLELPTLNFLKNDKLVQKLTIVCSTER